MPGTRRAETAWLAVAAATLCGIVVAMNIGKLPIALPYLRSEFGLSLSEAGWLAAAFSALAILFGLLIGIMADRFGALRFCLLGLAVSTVRRPAWASTGTSEWESAVADLPPRRRRLGFLAVSGLRPRPGGRRQRTARTSALTLGIWSCYMPAGASLCVLLAPLLLERGGWRGLWWLVLLLLAGRVPRR
jgi:CP family cyanate transporter-like MFS transporter